MTSPSNYDPEFATRLRAANAALGDKPELALTLAGSDVSEMDINRVGGFTRTLENSQLVALSRLSGARTELSAEERSQLDAMGVDYDDVNDGPDNDERNWLERLFDTGATALANTGKFIADLPGVSQVFEAMDWLNDVAHLPARILSSAIDTENDDEVDAAMRAKGYDPESPWDYIQFMTNQGDSLYHDLDNLRETYGDRLVDLAIEQHADPEEFAARLGERDQETQDLVMGGDFGHVADLVDRQHISPGRDLARLLTFGNVDSPAFTAISGTLDGAYTLLLDPTLMAGKVASGVRALDHTGQALRQSSRLDRWTGVAGLTRAVGSTRLGATFRQGIRDATDQDGIRNLLAVDADGNAVTRVGQGVQSFLNKVKEFDEADAAGDVAARDAVFARLSAEHRDLMPLFDEVRGKRVITPTAAEAWAVADDEATSLLDELESQALPYQLELDAVTAGHTMVVRRLDDGTYVSDSKVIDRGAVTEHRTVQSVERATDPATGENVWRYDIGQGDTVTVRRKPQKKTGGWPYLIDRRAPMRATGDVPVITDAGPSFEHVLKDVNGVGWLATQGDAIRDLDDFADYFASTAGLLRLAGGAAAKRELLLPGRVALRQRIAGWNAERRQGRVNLLGAEIGGRAAERNEVIYDHTRPYANLPHESEEIHQKAMDELERLRDSGEIDAGEFARRGDQILQEIRRTQGEHPLSIRRLRARWEQRARRVSSLLPTVQALDLTSSGSIEQINRFARLYMNKTEADRLTAMYAAGDLGMRRQVAHGIIEQTFHAAGLSRSEEGLAFIERWRGAQATVEKQRYGLNRVDVIKTPAGERHVALLPSQLSEHVTLPGFRELQYMASKYAVGGAMVRTNRMRAFLTSESADAIIRPIKQGWITSAAGGFRNALDEIAGMVLRGEGTSLLHGRAAFTAARVGQRTEGTARLERSLWGSIPRGLRGLARKADDVLVARGLGHLLHFRDDFDDLSVKHAEELLEDYRAEVLDDTVTGTYLGHDMIGADEVIQAHKDGIHATRMTHNGELIKHEFQGYGQIAVDGGQGLNAFTHNLGLAFQDLSSPAHVALRELIQNGDPLTAVAEYMYSDAMRHFLRNAERFKFTPSGRPVRTAEDLAEAVDKYASDLTAHITMLVGGRGVQLSDEGDDVAGALARYEFDVTQPGFYNQPEYQVGPINRDMAEMLLRGEIPDAAWLKANLADDELPSHVIGKLWAPVNPRHAVGQIAQGYTHMLTKAYDFVVTRQIRALSRNPMLTAAYDQARRNIAGFEKHLIDNGFTEEIAETIARRHARTQAEHLVIKSIDNPNLSTQYAMLARNFHAFARAQEDWLRRWGRIIRDNPEVIRRGQLYLHGAESAGLVERDDQGNLIFTYPGSGMIINLLGKLTSKIPGMPDMANIPVIPDLTSQLIFLNPSLDNPIGFSATPLISIPFDAIAATTGSDYALLKSSMDRVLNGDLGAGREWYEKILPGFANRLIQGWVQDEDPASQYASAYTSALVNLEAAGRLDELDGTDPSAIARFQNDLKAQISNQMVMRALFGFVLPAAPSVPTNDVIDVETGERILKPDYVWEKAGLSSLKDEARKVFGTMPYEEALVWWAKHHPGELVYQVGTTPRTAVGDSEAQAPATIAAAKWMQENPYLLGKYGGRGGIATYFMPQGEGAEGEFSMDAYRAQLETGIRDYKTLDQFFDDIVTQRGEALYFDTKDDYDAAITEATANGNQYEVDRLEAEWAKQKESILWSNPLLAAKFAEYATSGTARERTVGQLNELLSDPDAVEAIGPQAGGVAELLLAQRRYEAARQSVYGERGYLATTTRQNAKAEFEAAIADVVSRYPGLGDLARGAFRVPD